MRKDRTEQYRRWRGCGRKKRFGSLRAAERARLRTGNRRTQRGSIAYKCEWCGGYHFGHQKKTRRQWADEVYGIKLNA